jgi:hypothetical protein
MRMSVRRLSPLVAYTLGLAVTVLHVDSSAVDHAPTSPAGAHKAEWTVVNNVDAVPGAGTHSVLLGSSGSVVTCEALCNNHSGCNIWTWNHEVLSPISCMFVHIASAQVHSSVVRFISIAEGRMLVS